METIVITSRDRFDFGLMRYQLEQFWQVEDTARGGLVLEEDNSRIYIYCLDEPDTGEHRLLVDYRDVELIKKVIEIIADDSALIVDNDFDTVLPGDKFVARIKSEKGWNWRNDLPAQESEQ